MDEFVEDLLCRLGLAVRVEQRGKLRGATSGVVDRALAMKSKGLLSPLACLVELAKLMAEQHLQPSLAGLRPI